MVSNSEKEIYGFWVEKIKNGRLYHGTCKYFLKNICERGLNPKFSPLDKKDIYFVIKMFKKCGNFDVSKSFRIKDPSISFTIRKSIALTHAERSSPEILSYDMLGYISDILRGVKNKNIRYDYPTANELKKLKILYKKYHKLEKITKNSGPILLSLPLTSKFVLSELGSEYKKIILDFREFKKDLSKYNMQCSQFYDCFFNNLIEVKIKHKIPFRYLSVESV